MSVNVAPEPMRPTQTQSTGAADESSAAQILSEFRLIKSTHGGHRFPDGICDACSRLTLEHLVEVGGGIYSFGRTIAFSTPLLATCPLCRLVKTILNTDGQVQPNPMTPITGRIHTSRVSSIHHEYLSWKPDTGVEEQGPEQLDYIELIEADIPTDARLYLVADGGHRISWLQRSLRNLPILQVPNSYAARVLNGRFATPPGSPAAFTHIKHLLRNCERNHEVCRTGLSGTRVSGQRRGLKTPLPSRLVQVAAGKVKLRLDDGYQGMYAALSYCWGGVSPKVLTKANLAAMQQHIDVTELPKTCKEAIEICRTLGIPYIWIDSLCIVQDDPDDWQREASRMSYYYDRAHITIAASSATKSTEGCIVPRPPQQSVRMPCSAEDSRKGYFYFSSRSKRTGIFAQPLQGTPLNQRAWVFQERMLSRRIVHCTASQLYWQCKTLTMSEESTQQVYWNGGADDFVHGLEETIEELKNDSESTAGQFYDLWQDIVMYYSSLNITFARDRYMAFFGVLSEVTKKMSARFERHGQFLEQALHWWNDESPALFATSLLWTAVSDTGIARPEKIQVPSWSWLSHNAAITYPLNAVEHLPSPPALQHFCATIAILPDYGHRYLALRICGFLGTAKRGKPIVNQPTTYLPGNPNAHTEASRKGTLPCSHMYDDTQYLGEVRFDRAEERPEHFLYCPIHVTDNRLTLNSKCGPSPDKHTRESKPPVVVLALKEVDTSDRNGRYGPFYGVMTPASKTTEMLENKSVRKFERIGMGYVFMSEEAAGNDESVGSEYFSKWDKSEFLLV